MLNPDGVFNGSGQNTLGQGLNREWEDLLAPGGTPEVDTIRPVIWHETDQKVDWAIDIHGNPGSNIPYYWWGYTQDSGMPQWQIAKAQEYVEAVADGDRSAPGNASSYQNTIQGNGANASKTAANWFRRSFEAIAYTFEPTSEPMGPIGNNAYTIQQLREAGSSLAKGFYAVFDTVQALGGQVVAADDLLYVQVTGGHLPYTFKWTGSLSSSEDTLFAPPPGKYKIAVTDAMGCQWEQELVYGSTSIDPSSEFPVQVYPNPTQGPLTVCLDKVYPDVTMKAYNMTGQEMMSRTFGTTRELQCSVELPKGMYSVSITSGKSLFIIFHILIN
jgi:hypothetical protein